MTFLAKRRTEIIAYKLICFLLPPSDYQTVKVKKAADKEVQSTPQAYSLML